MDPSSSSLFILNGPPDRICLGGERSKCVHSFLTGKKGGRHNEFVATLLRGPVGIMYGLMTKVFFNNTRGLRS